jgi:hypothetical protein
MRLLDKKTVSTEVATQRVQLAKTGLQLAKKVDALREARAEEEKNLENFRTQTIARVQKDIDSKILEKENLRKELIPLQNEWKRLQTPPDLTSAREDVAKRQEEVMLREIAVNLAESNVKMAISLNISRERENEEERQRLAMLKKRAEEFLAKAEIRHTQAEDTFSEAKRTTEKAETYAAEVENHLKVRNQEATDREVYLSQYQERVQAWEVDLAAREKKLKVNQAIFMRSKAYLTGKKKVT